MNTSRISRGLTTGDAVLLHITSESESLHEANEASLR